MAKLFPPSLTELQQSRVFVPESEKKFFNITKALSADWYVWHSVNWDCDTKRMSGEADFLLFNKEYGFIVFEVKGGIISVERNKFYSTNTHTFKKSKIKNPFNQARTSMHHIVRCYEKLAKKQPDKNKLLKKGGFFPLNFCYAVFFPDTPFKDDFDYLQYQDNRIFDSIDYENQMDQMAESKYQKTILEEFLIDLLDIHKEKRVKVQGIGEFFPKFIGGNIYHYLSTKKFLKVRARELRRVNRYQDYLLMALSEKRRCIFKGSAGSGKTFLAMKKAILNYNHNLKSLFLCYNQELRQSIREYISNKLKVRYEVLQSKIGIFSIIQYLYYLSEQHFFSQEKEQLQELLKDSADPPYDLIAQIIKDSSNKIPDKFKYDTILIDEAQDIDKHVWELFPYFLRDTYNSFLYIFYDEEQAIFKDDFRPESVGCNENKDIIVLKKNLRNTIEIAKYINLLTGLGNYEQLSGINGFKITKRKVPDAQGAIIRSLVEIKNKYLKNEIKSKKIAILSHKKLKTLNENASSNELCDYLFMKDPDGTTSMVITEPKKLSKIGEIEDLFKTDQIAVFKTISSFKGLERDIIFLIFPKPEHYKKKYPQHYDDFLKKLYVGASRAKFKLHLMEYPLY